MNPKLLVVLIVLLVILFFVGVGLGIGQDDESAADLDPSWVEGIGDLLAGRQSLAASDLDQATPATCRQQFGQGAFVLTEGSACLLVIKNSSDSVRTLSLQLVQGSSAQVDLVQEGDKGINANQTLESGRSDMKVQFLEEGGQLQVGCLDSGSADACRITLK